MRFSSYVYRQRSREMLPHFSPDLHYTISVEGEMAVPRSGRRSIRPTANF